MHQVNRVCVVCLVRFVVYVHAQRFYHDLRFSHDLLGVAWKGTACATYPPPHSSHAAVV
jgi:hypothetical protein